MKPGYIITLAKLGGIGIGAVGTAWRAVNMPGTTSHGSLQGRRPKAVMTIMVTSIKIRPP